MENMEKEGVIIFGGSAGSIDVIMNIFPLIPKGFSLPIVVVLHRKNTAEHHLEDVLNRKSKIPVLEVQDKMKIQPGNIYIAPGDYHLLVDKHGILCLDNSEKVNYSRPSIDITFECFAKVYQHKCIGILLSGANSDGAFGLKKIKEEGGLTIVQSPDSAKVATMPMAALNLFQPDLIADIQKLIGLLLKAGNYPIDHFVGRIKKGEDLTSDLPSILLVDDLEENLFSLNAILKSEGLLIDKAISGKLAIDMAMKKSYDCIVLDVQMPEMDGFEVARFLASNDLTCNIPILFLSALGSDKEKVVEGLESGAMDFLAKPPDPQILKAKIKNCIQFSRKNKEKNKKLVSINTEYESLKEYTTDISASFRYAQNIQQAILPNIETVSAAFTDCFVIYQPKEVIGGDFYYIKTIGSKTIFISGDCTGHGVPGAMMSMMSVNILNNIIDTKGITRPDLVLKAMVGEFVTAFRNEHNSITIQDGLEISVCLFDKEENKLFYSGAGGHIFIYSNGELKKIKSSSVGISSSYSRSESFTLDHFEAYPDFKIYLYSDGVVDQFGGPSSKKFMTKRLEKAILSCVHEPMSVQKEIFRKVIADWMGKEEQIDDISLFGLQM